MLRISPDLFKEVEKWADDEFRSVNGQLEWMVYQCLKEAKRLPKDKGKNTDPEGP